MAKIFYAYLRPLSMSREEATLHAQRWGLKRLDPDRDREFNLDVAPKRVDPKKDHAPTRTVLVRGPHGLDIKFKDILGVPRADMLGKDLADVDKTRKAVLRLGVPILELTTDTLVEPSGKDAVARSDAFMESAALHFKASAIRARRAGQARTGNKGGRPPSLTFDQKRLILPVWVEEGHGKVREREKLAGALVGRTHVAASNMERWFDCGVGAGEVGPNAEVKPPKRARRAPPKAKPKPKRKVSRGKTR